VDEPLLRDNIYELVHAYAFMPWAWMYGSPVPASEGDSLVSIQRSLYLHTEIEKLGVRWPHLREDWDKCMKYVHVARMYRAKGNRIIDLGYSWDSTRGQTPSISIE
jgi:hypothetical protein